MNFSTLRTIKKDKIKIMNIHNYQYLGTIFREGNMINIAASTTQNIQGDKNI